MPKPYDDTNNADWKTSAMTHDLLVVDILLHLKHTASRTICSDKLVADLAPAGWGAKQPRSGCVTTTVSGSKSVSGCRRIGRTCRCSPSTPLSWSGGSGGGGGVDGCDTSSLPLNQSPNFRSKNILAGTEVNCASSSKHKKKKTYAQLKVEEVMILRERIHLNQKLAMLGAIVEEHRAENKTLKRIKLNLKTQSLKSNTCNPSGTCRPRAAARTKAVMKREKHDRVSLAVISNRVTPSSTSFHAESDVIPWQKSYNFMLPDLNMMPSELESAN